jgi:hypothetical protein
MNPRAVLFACAVAAAGPWACRSGPPIIGDPPPTLDDPDAEQIYREILDRYTGRGEIYTGLDTQLFAGATYQSWPFRQARVKRLARFQRMSVEEIEARLKQERADWEQKYVFDLGAWVEDPKFDDFDRKDSVWRIALVADGGGELLPIDVRRESRVDQNIRAIYPYMGTFWVKYRVVFPRQGPDGAPLLPNGTKAFTLRLASALGRADLHMQAD